MVRFEWAVASVTPLKNPTNGAGLRRGHFEGVSIKNIMEKLMAIKEPCPECGADTPSAAIMNYSKSEPRPMCLKCYFKISEERSKRLFSIFKGAKN